MSGAVTPLSVDTSIPLQAGKIPERPNPFTPVNQLAETWRGINAAKSSDVSLSQQTRQAAYSAMLPMLAKPPEQWTISEMTSMAARAERSGVPMAGFLADLAAHGGGDGKALYQNMVSRIAPFSQTDAGAALTQVAGSPADISTGLGVQSGTRAPAYMGGGFRPATETQVFPSRAEQMGRTQIGTGPGGEPITGPIETVTPSHLLRPGGSPFTTGGAYVAPAQRGLIGPGGLPGGQQRAPVPGGGQIPPSPGATPMPGSPAVNPGLPVGAAVIGIGPARQSEETARGSSSSGAFQKISDLGTTARTQDSVLANLHNDLQQFEPGPGVEITSHIKKVLSTWGPTIPVIGGKFGIDTEKLGAYESFQKLVSQLADAQGAGSDARLNVTIHANPSAALTKPGLDLIIRQLRGNSDYLRVRQQLADQWPDKTDVRAFEAQVGKNLDPRVFQYARMDEHQRRTYFANIKGKRDQDDFKAGYMWARQNQLIGE